MNAAPRPAHNVPHLLEPPWPTCPARLCPQAELAALLQLAEDIFPEGHGAPRAARVVGAAAPFINALVVNSKGAADELWKLRKYDPKTPDVIKARLGYRTDDSTTEASARTYSILSVVAQLRQCTGASV